MSSRGESLVRPLIEKEDSSSDNGSTVANTDDQSFLNDLIGEERPPISKMEEDYLELGSLAQREINNIDNYDITIRSLSHEDDYEIIAVFSTRIFKIQITKEYLSSCPPVIQAYPFSLRESLEAHLHSMTPHHEFFRFKYYPTQINLIFTLDFKIIQEDLTLVLPEITQTTFEDRIDKRIKELEGKYEPVVLIIDNSHVMDIELEEEEERNMISSYNHALANQKEKEQMGEIYRNYFSLVSNGNMKDDKSMFRVEPLRWIEFKDRILIQGGTCLKEITLPRELPNRLLDGWAVMGNKLKQQPRVFNTAGGAGGNHHSHPVTLSASYSGLYQIRFNADGAQQWVSYRGYCPVNLVIWKD